MERDLIQVSIILSLLPIISKIYVSFINDSLTEQLDITGLQYGFRSFRSTADIQTVLSEYIYNLLDAGGETDYCTWYLKGIQ